MISFAIGFILTALVVYLYYNSKHGDLDQLPGPTAFQLYKTMRKSNAEILNFMLNATRTYGTVVKLWVKPFSPMVLVADHEIVCKILKSDKHLHKSHFYKALLVFFGENLGTTMSVDKWKHDRKELNLCFSTKYIQHSVEVYEKRLEDLLKHLRNSLNRPVDVEKFVNLYTMESAIEMSTRKQHNLQQTKDYTFIELMHEVFAIATTRMNSLLLQSDFLFKFTTLYKNGLHASKILNTLVTCVDKSTANDKIDILNVVLNSKIQEGSKYDALLMFIIGAHDTIKSTVSFCLYELSRRPDVQKKILEEIADTVASDRNKMITFEEASRLQYLKCVIKETMRLNTPVPFIQRCLGEHLEMHGKVVPTGTNVVLSLVGMHMDEKTFPDCDQFKPERFLPQNNKSILTDAFAPFALGKRDCIGKKLAWLALSGVVANIVRNFEIHPVENHKLDVELDFVSTSRNGFPVILKEKLI